MTELDPLIRPPHPSGTPTGSGTAHDRPIARGSGSGSAQFPAVAPTRSGSGSGSNGGQPSASALRPVGPPARIDRFDVLGELGRGGMGVVYRARDAGTGHEVALKVLLGEVDERRRARFVREGQATAGLDHPGIVKVHAAGEWEGRPFVAYELVAGARTLDTLLRDLPLRRRIELLRDAARALGAAHAQGLVHRDVKGENLLVDAQGCLKVADFGLVGGEGLERLTRTGAMLGTPHAMAPEQFQGDREQQGPPTDVWGLGVLLYEALTGEPPFAADSAAELGVRICDGTLEPPRALAPDAPADLEAVCLVCLARAPAGRYPDGAALADELDRWLAGAPVRARAPRRAGRLALGLAACVAALGAGVLVSLPGNPPASDRLAPVSNPDASGPLAAQTAGPSPAATTTSAPPGPAALHPVAVGPASWFDRAMTGRRRAREPLLRLRHAAVPPGGAHVEFRVQAAFIDDARVLTVGRMLRGGALVACVWSLDAPDAPVEQWPTESEASFVEVVGTPTPLVGLAAGVLQPGEAATWWHRPPQRHALDGITSTGAEVLVGQNGPDADGAVLCIALGRRPRVVCRTPDRVKGLSAQGGLVAIVTSAGDQGLGAGEAFVVDVATGVVRARVQLVANGRCIALSPDQRRVAVGLGGGYIRIYSADGELEMGLDLPDPAGLARQAGHSAAVNGLVFEGHRLWSAAATSSQPYQGELLAWDLAAGGALLPELTQRASDAEDGHAGFATLDRSPDGRALLGGTLGGEAVIWALPRPR